MANIRIVTKLYILIAIFVCSLSAFGLLAFVTIEKVKINSPLYQTIALEKDLVADILPPSLNLTEPYLVAIKLLRENEETEQKTLIEKGSSLKKEFLARHEYWTTHLDDPKVKSLVLDDSYRIAMRFFDEFESKYLPLLRNSDLLGSSKVLNEDLKSLYLQHQKINGEILKLASAQVEESEKAAAATLSSNIIALFVAGVLLLCLSIFVCVLIVRSIASPLALMQNIFKKISQGIIKEQFLVIENKDEIGQIALKMNELLHSITSIIVFLEKVGTGTEVEKVIYLSKADEIATACNGMIERLKSTIVKIHTRMLQVEDDAKRLGATSEELAQGAQEQAAAVEETSAAIEQINSMIKNSSESTAKSLNISKQNQASAEKGMQIVHEMDGAVKSISEGNVASVTQIEESNKKLINIIEVIREIGNKTKIINDIVFQTRLLSFNASVEAARAGEHGKGFSVVAEEIGKLAKMSGTASQEISQMLQESIGKVEVIVSGTRKNMQGMIESSEQNIQKGLQVAEQCKMVLQEIVESAKLLQENINEISNAATEEATGMAEIAKSISQMAQSTQQIASNADANASIATVLTSQAESVSQELSLFKL